VTASVEFDRLVDRAAICREIGEIVERRQFHAMRNAEYLAAPRLQLVDEERRIVRVVNAPVEARSRPPKILRHYYDDAMYRKGVEPVGIFHNQPFWRDLDYRIVRTAPGNALLAMLRDDINPSVVMPARQPRDGALETTFER
jgi:hypothetical protein